MFIYKNLYVSILFCVVRQPSLFSSNLSQRPASILTRLNPKFVWDSHSSSFWWDSLLKMHIFALDFVRFLAGLVTANWFWFTGTQISSIDLGFLIEINSAFCWLCLWSYRPVVLLFIICRFRQRSEFTGMAAERW